MDEELLKQILTTLGLSEIRNDSNATAALTRQLEHIRTKDYDVLYANLKARLFIPVSNEADPGAESIIARSWNHTGMAEIIANYADDLPLVDAFVSETPVKVQTLGSAFIYTLLDLRRAAKAQSDLDSRRAGAARLAVERKLDRIAAIGDAPSGLRGFVNHPNVPLVSLPNGSWATATADEIQEDMAFLVQSIVTNSMEVHAPDSLLLDTASFMIINQKPIGVDNKQTILKSFLENNPYIKNIDQWTRLNLANAAGDGPRIVAYQRDPMMVELDIPMEFEQLPPQARNMAFVVACWLRTAGVTFHYPLSAAYSDDI